MLVRKFEPSRPYRFARYGRMSDRLQNKRSPDQQFATIDETINRCGYPWLGVTSYRDDGISGRYIRKRAGLQALLRDIETGVLQVDLIVVDTLERLGRADEIGEIRRKLFVEYGVLVVAADNNFADPTGVVGKAVGLVENIRSTEDGRIKAHNVIRGKKDAARLRRWPGGPPPFGFRLKPVINNTVTPPEIYNVLEQDPEQAAALRLAFERAAATGEGDLRLSQWWNECLEIPDAFKPINPFTMSYRLKNPIAIGTLRWGYKRTGVVNDTRVVEPNPDGAELIRDFCQPIVGVELYEGVQRLQLARGQQIRASRWRKAGDEPVKLIAPQAQGLTLKYLLTGLVRCGCCNASMRAVPSGRRSKGGRRYTYYTCPRHYERACRNGRHVQEESLRDAVLTRVRGRLFPVPELPREHPSWFPELLSLVRLEQERYRDSEPDRHAADRDEDHRLEQLLSGWMLTLGNPLKTKAIAEAKVKTDKVDALVLAQLLRCDYLPAVWQPDEQTQRWRGLVTHRTALMTQRTRLKNHIQSLLARLLLQPPGKCLWTKAGLAWLKGLDLPAGERLVLDSELRQLATVEQEVDQLDEQLTEIARQEPRVRLLMTLPGVSYVVALGLLAALGDVTRFQDGDHAVAYLGLVPSTHQSGRRCYQGPITKAGSSQTRWLLNQAAQHVARHAGPLGAFFRRLVKRKNRNVAITAVARKLVTVAFLMLKNNEPYRYARPELMRKKFTTLKVKDAGSNKVRTRGKPGLADVYQAAGLPRVTRPEDLPPGESQMLSERKLNDFVEDLYQPKARQRKECGAREASRKR